MKRILILAALLLAGCDQRPPVVCEQWGLGSATDVRSRPQAVCLKWAVKQAPEWTNL